MKVHRNQRQQQGHKVAEIVSGLGEQGKGMGAKSGYDQQADVAGGNDERYTEYLGSALVRSMGMDVHVFSLRRARAGFKIAMSKRLFRLCGKSRFLRPEGLRNDKDLF